MTPATLLRAASAGCMIACIPSNVSPIIRIALVRADRTEVSRAFTTTELQETTDIINPIDIELNNMLDVMEKQPWLA